MTDVRTLFTSDPHFHHKNIVKFTERGKDTTQENHDEWLINLWNTQVRPWDKVYMLGDFSFSHKYSDISSVVSRLNGQKFFIIGNHDAEDADDAKIFQQLKDDKLIQNWYVYKIIKIGSTKTCLFHFPIESWNKSHHGGFHLHGHCHGALKTQLQGKRLDVGLDSAYNYFGEHKFFTEEDIIELLQDRPIHQTDHHKNKEGM